MRWPVILAHGTLGIWDEIIFVSIAVIFIVMMAISWLRSRGAVDDDEAAEPQADTLSPAADEKPEAADRFRLD